MEKTLKQYKNDVEEVAASIFNYLQENPDAGDTLEGITTWWLLRQRLGESLAMVQEAIEQLKAKGLVVEQKRMDTGNLYFINNESEGLSE